MDLGLQDKVVLVTGASGDIGAAMVEAFVAEGCEVVAQGLHRVDELRSRCADGPVHVVRADLGDAVSVQEMYDQLAHDVGRIDVLIANAGRWPEPDLRLDQTPVEDLDRVLVDNLLSAMLTARGFMQQLAARGPRADGHGASITFTGSTAGRFGEAGHVAYSAAKAGILGLVRTLKNELVHLDPWARVNVIEPGWTATTRVREGLGQPESASRALQTMPLRQLARCEDIARAAVFLASPLAARHVSGERLTVAGGMEGRRLWSPGETEVARMVRRLEPDF